MRTEINADLSGLSPAQLLTFRDRLAEEYPEHTVTIEFPACPPWCTLPADYSAVEAEHDWGRLHERRTGRPGISVSWFDGPPDGKSPRWGCLTDVTEFDDDDPAVVAAMIRSYAAALIENAEWLEAQR